MEKVSTLPTSWTGWIARRQSAIFKACMLALVASAILLGITRSLVDPDLWGHLRFGLDALENGSLARQDPYAYTTGGQAWINHEWLAELSFAVAWKLGGNLGLLLLKNCVEIITLGLAFGYLLWRKIQPLWAALIVLLFLPIMLPSMWSIRPHMYTNLTFALILFTIGLAERGHYRWLWAAPLAMCFWANAHGGFLAGLAVLGTWAAVHLMQQPRAWKQVVPPVVLAGLATLANPYGIELARFLLRTATGTRAEIVEWAPVQIRSTLGAIYLAELLLAAIGIYLERKSARWPLLAAWAGLAMAPLIAIRHIPLFGLGMMMLSGEHLYALRERFTRHEAKQVQLPIWLTLIPVIGMVGIMIAAVPTLYRLPIQAQGADFTYPSAAVDLLKKSEIRGNLMIDYNWGEYAIWYLAPRIKVGMDGRRETVYPEDIFGEYLNFYAGKRDWDAVLKNTPSDLVLVTNGSPPGNLLKLSPDWQVAYEDATSTLFVRRDYPAAQKLLQTASGFVSTEEEGEEEFP